MPRQHRLLLSQSYYHIMTRGNNRHIVFRNDGDYYYYMNLVKRFKSELPFDLYHYCLMPNHVHLLIKTKNADDFSLFMKKINLAYFHHYRKMYNWVGHFWQDRFKSQPIGKDEYFIQCGKYIELNPVRAGLVKQPQDYQYSSYNYYTGSAANNLITTDIFYDLLGDNPIDRHNKYQEIIIDDIIEETYKRNVWGSYEQCYNERKKIKNHLS